MSAHCQRPGLRVCKRPRHQSRNPPSRKLPLREQSAGKRSANIASVCRATYIAKSSMYDHILGEESLDQERHRSFRQGNRDNGSNLACKNSLDVPVVSRKDILDAAHGVGQCSRIVVSHSLTFPIRWRATGSRESFPSPCGKAE